MIKMNKKQLLFVCENFGINKPKFISSNINIEITKCFIIQYNVDTQVVRVKKTKKILLGDDKVIKMLEDRIKNILISYSEQKVKGRVDNKVD